MQHRSPSPAGAPGRPTAERYPVSFRGVSGPEIDWEALRSAATEACGRAYAPYSDFPVGAAGLVDDGRIVAAANVENASYGLSTCAELGVAVQLHATGGGTLVALAVVGRDGEPLVPCGRCRQVLMEHGGPDLLVDGRPLRELLPDAFGREHLG
jgi:cytidine deaminase